MVVYDCSFLLTVNKYGRCVWMDGIASLRKLFSIFYQFTFSLGEWSDFVSGKVPVVDFEQWKVQYIRILLTIWGVSVWLSTKMYFCVTYIDWVYTELGWNQKTEIDKINTSKRPNRFECLPSARNMIVWSNSGRLNSMFLKPIPYNTLPSRGDDC